jgi:hypothetical protein
MIKKVLSTVLAAAALSIPFTGVASAGPDEPQNGNGKGKGPGVFGEAPGNFFSKGSQQVTPGSNLPHILRQGGLRSPGELVRIALGN